MLSATGILRVRQRPGTRRKRFAVRLSVWLRARMRSNEFFLVLLSLGIGVAGGVIVTAMGMITQLAHVLIYGIKIDVRLSANDTVNPVIALCALAAGGLLLGAMEWYRRKWNISNATDPVEANALRGGRLSLRDSVIVSVQTLISNGCGASVGLEAGYTQICSGIASLFGRHLNLRRNDLRIIVGCGAAAAIAAAFNSPFAGAFYACELIVGVYSVSSAAPILAASITSVLVTQHLGAPTYSLKELNAPEVTSQSYLLMMLLAVVISVIGIVIMWLAPVAERQFNRAALPVWSRPAMGGVLVAGLSAFTPQVLAAGHGAMLLDLSSNLQASHLAALMGLKIVACLISLGSGFRGGLFFASLFIGSLAGDLFAALLNSWGVQFDVSVAAVTGMASLGAAIVGGPLTMSFLVLEMTRSLDLTAGVLGACIATSIVVRALFGHTFSTWRLHLRGETIRSANDVGWLRSLTVERLMRGDAVVLASESTIAECRKKASLGSCQAIFLVDRSGRYCGTVLLADLFSSDYDLIADTRPVTQISKYVDTVLSPEQNIKIAMSYFDKAEAEVLPVLSVDGGGIIGYVSEAFARKRYAEEIERATASVFQ